MQKHLTLDRLGEVAISFIAFERLKPPNSFTSTWATALVAISFIAFERLKHVYDRFAFKMGISRNFFYRV